MKKLIGSCLISAAVIIACGSYSEEEKKDSDTAPAAAEFVSLFDGKTLNGWHKFNGGTPGKAWTVEDGMLHFAPGELKDWQAADGGDIVSAEEYENFHFKLEWKISKNGNSGIMFMVKEDTMYKYPWNTGPEMQVLDNDGHPDGKIIKHRAGDLYDLVSCSTETVKPVGEWNLAEIIMNKGQLQLRLNDVTVVTTSYGDDAWKKMLASSKFKNMPDFGKFTKGRIALQDHGNHVWFRNIMIKKL